MKRVYIDPLLGKSLAMTSAESKNAPTQKYISITPNKPYHELQQAKNDIDR